MKPPLIALFLAAFLLALSSACGDNAKSKEKKSSESTGANSSQNSQEPSSQPASQAGAKNSSTPIEDATKEIPTPELILKPGTDLACFPDAGPVVMRVEGVDVPKGAIDRAAAVYAWYKPGLSEASCLRAAIENSIIPIAAQYAKWRSSQLPEMTRRAWKIWDQLERGEDWLEVLHESSDDPNRKLTNGSMGLRRRLETPGLGQVGAFITELAWSLPLKRHSRPVLSDQGIQLIYVASEEKGATDNPLEAVRDIQRILISWDPEYSSFLRNYNRQDASAEGKLKRFKEQARRMIGAARVELIDESYRKAIYPFRLKKR